MAANPRPKSRTKISPWIALWIVILGGAGAWRVMTRADDGEPRDSPAISPEKLKVVDGREYLWAAGPRDDPHSQWFDITGSPLKKERFQYGIGKDRIRAIDDPVFTRPDDPRLLAALGCDAQSIDGTRVIGFADGDDARAYPVELLNKHELVNDTVAGKPVTVGW